MRNMHFLFPASLALLLAAPAIAQAAESERPDLNRDGKITQAEALEIAELRFNASDTNQDGVLSREEMREAALKRFTNQDTNGDGAITRKELRASFMSAR